MAAKGKALVFLQSASLPWLKPDAPPTLLHPNDGKDEHDQNHNYNVNFADLVVCDAGGEKEGKLFDLGKMLN